MATRKVTDDTPVGKRRPDPTPKLVEQRWPKGATPYIVDGVRVTHGEYVAHKRALRKQEALRLLSGESDPTQAADAATTPAVAEEA